MTWPDYELLDFGEGRKLERFGDWVLDRPCPTAADLPKDEPERWQDAMARFKGDRTNEGRWSPAIKRWQSAECAIHAGDTLGITFQLSPLPSGQIGLFPEQHANWLWIARQVARIEKPLRVLNLFAYTGGSTLAAAAAGAEVTHVDAARSMVALARTNAEASGLADRPIRWIVEDVLTFCQREVKRGNQYDAILLDPPSYGHGPKGERWSIGQDLLPLLKLCGKLTTGRRAFVLATCHTPTIGPAELSAYLSDGLFGSCGRPPQSGTLYLQTTTGRRLDSGVFARWPG